MLRLSTVLSDLNKFYKEYKFNNKTEINKILLSFFELKFQLYLIEQENELDLMKRHNNIIEFINDYSFLPEKKYIPTIKEVIGFKDKFINDFKDELFEAIPNSLKRIKENKLNSFSDKRIEIQNNFFFFKKIINISIDNQDLNFDFLLKNFNLEKKDIPIYLQYIFDLKCSEIEYIGFERNLRKIYSKIYFNTNVKNKKNLFLEYKYAFYVILSLLCCSSIEKYFFGSWYCLPENERNNYKVRAFYNNRSLLKKEILNRNLDINFVYKDRNLDQAILLINNEKVFNDMFSLLNFLKSTLIHLD